MASAIDRAKVLAAVDDVMVGPVVWGVSDCCTSVGRCYALLHGWNPMAAWAHRYRTARGALRLARGDLAGVAGRYLRANGFASGPAVPGALGFLPLPDSRFGVIAAICLGGAVWVHRTDGGFDVVAADVEALTCHKR